MRKRDFERMYNPCGLTFPKRLAKRSAFCAVQRFIAPKEIFCDSMITPIENQGSLPWCAAYSASNFAECVLWKKRGYPPEIDPAPIYRHAKTIDGDPEGDGTLLECAMDGLLELGLFDRATCKIKTFGGSLFGFGNDGLNAVKFAIHRYGCCIAGFQITSDWYTPVNGVLKGGNGSTLGGHAVTICGYDDGGVMIANSWGKEWAHEGKVYMPNDIFNRQFIYGCVLTRCLDGLE